VEPKHRGRHRFVFQGTLAEGTYQLRVSNDNGFDTDYGLAWRGDLVAAPEPVVLLGDCDLNGVVDFFDISPFVAILTVSGFQEEADCNEDGFVNFFDISPFIQILSSTSN